MKNIVWLHEDALRADHPAVVQAGTDAELFYIWDEHYLQAMDYGFKRLVFIYETLCELPLRVCQGDTVQTLAALMDSTQAECLYIPATPNPELQQRIQQLASRYNVRVVEDIPFVDLSTEPDIKRFFRYWNKAKKVAMQATSTEQEKN
ncbi:MAG: deoxyribodipyrimidine photo-lyase [Gammaproteobacteria bacterium]